MCVNVKPKFKSYDTCKKLLVMLLFFSLLSYILVTDVVGASLEGVVHVGTEDELEDAINNASMDVSVVIVLDRDIHLTAELVIPTNRNITLTSNNNVEFFKLFGAAENQSTIVVEAGGVLHLDGVIVTHASGDSGCGVIVNSSGMLILYDGAISNNTAVINGIVGGVINNGTFIMSGGEISNNNAAMGSCGGVVNNGVFTMSGGEISSNFGYTSGGVYNGGSFSMSGGVISDNEVGSRGTGGGVLNHGSFIMSGGEISINDATVAPGQGGGGVSIYAGSFSMSGGMISGNLASWFGTVGGSVPSDHGIGYGGGVYVEGGVFNLFDGVISGNLATWSGEVLSGYGGGVYVTDGVFKMRGGKLLDNSALVNGGGIGVPDVESLDRVFVFDGVVFSNNSASVAYSRNSAHNELYAKQVGDNVTWTAPFIQGYNNYDISYTSGPQIIDPNTSGSQITDPSNLEGRPSIILFVAISVILIVSVFVVVLFFCFRKRRYCVEEKNGIPVEG